MVFMYLYQVFPSRLSAVLGILYTLLLYKQYNEHHMLQRGLLITKKLSPCQMKGSKLSNTRLQHPSTERNPVQIYVNYLLGTELTGDF